MRQTYHWKTVMSFTSENMLQDTYQLISELGKLKLVFRNTCTQSERQESTAEHSWSASMIVMILMENLKQEFGTVDELKTLKLTLIHDIVEIYAGDVIAFDMEARKNKETVETEALEKLVALCPHFGKQLHELWYEFEKKETIEAKIAKAADSICPIFQRIQSQQSYIPFGIDLTILDTTKVSHFKFSQTYTHLYQKLKQDLLSQGLIQSAT